MSSSNQLFQRQIKSGNLSRPSRLKFRKSHSTMASNWLETILTPPSPLRALIRSGRRLDIFVLVNKTFVASRSMGAVLVSVEIGRIDVISHQCAGAATGSTA